MSKTLCTPFCNPKKPCEKPHHDLLIAILNCPSDIIPKEKGKKTDSLVLGLRELDLCIQTYTKKGWDKNDPVPDELEDFQFPLVHWACVLGKLKALEWLVQNGFETTVLAPKTKETALHRCLLLTSNPYLSRKALENKMLILVDITKDCLLLKDSLLNTPLHIAARQLLEGWKRPYFEDCIQLLISKLNQFFPDEAVDVLNAKNTCGNTAVHILASSEQGFFALRILINKGAVTSLKNNNEKTPLDIAKEWGSLRVITLLNRVNNKEIAGDMSDLASVCSQASTTTANSDILQEESDDASVREDNGTTGNEENPLSILDSPQDKNKPTNCNSPVTINPSEPQQPACTCTDIKVEKSLQQQLQDMNDGHLLSSGQNNNVAFLEVLRGAELWNQLLDMTVKRRSENGKSLTTKLEELQATNEAIQDAEKTVEATQQKVITKESELSKITQDLDHCKSELTYMTKESEELKRKRSSLNDECSTLEKKLHYCDSLLKIEGALESNKSC